MNPGAKAECLIAGFFSEHHVPHSKADHLIDVLKRAFPDSEIAKKCTLKKTKLSYIVHEGFAHHKVSGLVKICQKHKFSVLLDESTDVSTTQVLAVVVRYFDEDKQDVCDALLDTIEVEDGSAQGLYQSLKAMLQEKKIPLENIIGFGSDNCSVMMGRTSGFQALLKQDVPSLFVMGCICHSFALCASQAVKMLPNFMEEFLRELTSYFSHSSKRLNDFRLIQDAVQVSQYRILKLAATRWLSRESVIARILEQWPALLLYFGSEVKENVRDHAFRVNRALNHRGTKHLLFFVQYILRKINAMNAEFQAEGFRLHVVHRRICAEYKAILCSFIKENILRDHPLHEIDPADGLVHVPTDDIYLGGAAMAEFSKDPIPDRAYDLKQACKRFLVEICQQIRKRVDLSQNSLLAKLQVIDPAVATNIDVSPRSITDVAAFFPALVAEDQLNQLDDEWREFRQSDDAGVKQDASIPSYWFNVRKIRNALNEPKFALLSHFMTSLTPLPHSTAAVERVFSEVNCTKTCRSNRMTSASVKNRILANQLVSRGGSCVTWNPPSSLVREIADGACFRRYQQRLNEQHEQDTITFAQLDAE